LSDVQLNEVIAVDAGCSKRSLDTDARERFLCAAYIVYRELGVTAAHGCVSQSPQLMRSESCVMLRWRASITLCGSRSARRRLALPMTNSKEDGLVLTTLLTQRSLSLFIDSMETAHARVAQRYDA
jgi:hypothetical protein